ncbi:MATE family efflux transporter [Novosphingobium sp. KCTC 2891]|uniref:MATE family efflux transporter n=1 Tax=Novosphingobium sp. KCTC 2891 TaxID=2989730 RepID=UPI002222AABF|nr:MATE family efflux transporter [Novosphingobium sp. KCTC 2891]MCW1384041.1 MATE family efflux transporter [Novosphingobium sp. KCTC 2891]
MPAPAAPSGRERAGHRDLTQGPILKTLLAFSATTLLSNVLQSLNGSVNSVWVGRMLGEDALAATANANVVMFLVFAGVFGFGMAATIKVGQAFGAGNIDAARRTFGTALGLCVGLSMLVAVAGWIWAPALLRLMATPGEVFSLALAYLRVIFVSVPAAMITVMVGMGLRGAGDSQTSLRFMILSVVLDVALNPMLIAGIGPFPRMGIAGSALSTAIASFVSMAALLFYVYARNLPLRLKGAEIRYLIPRRDELRYILTKGLPMGVQMLMISMAGVIMVGLVNREGAMVSAAYGASLQLWNYLQMPALAISAAVSAMAAQAIGAGLPDRLGRITRAGIGLNVAMTGAMTALLLLFDRPVLELFLGAGSPAVELARHIQYLAIWTYILFGVTIVFFGTMRAGGVVIAPLVILGITMYPIRLGFYALAHKTLGQDALWLAFPISSSVSTLLAGLAYRQRGWREKARVVPPDECAEETQADSDSSGRMVPAL